MSHVDFDTSFSINNVPVCDLWSGKSKSVHWMSIAHQHAHRHRLTGWYRLRSFCTSLGQRVVDNGAIAIGQERQHPPVCPKVVSLKWCEVRRQQK